MIVQGMHITPCGVRYAGRTIVVKGIQGTPWWRKVCRSRKVRRPRHGNPCIENSKDGQMTGEGSRGRGGEGRGGTRAEGARRNRGGETGEGKATREGRATKVNEGAY